jgi:uncharacterized membrane protein YfcA
LFYKAGHFNWKLFLPLGIASIPLSFLGGTITLDALLYKKILGILLLLTVIRFYKKSGEPEKKVNDVSLYLAVLVGAVIGLVSGIIGVGGGILLSPVLLMLRWSDQKQTAAISALFIFVNSMSGLAGQATQGVQFVPEMFVFIAVVFAGGLMGGWLGSFRATQRVLRYTLSAVLMLASYKLLCT